MINGRLPPQEVLDGVRHIAGWDHWFSAEVGKKMGNEGRRSYLRDKLRSIMSELEIEVSHRRAKAISRGVKLTYVVAYRGAVKLEFTDLLPDKPDSRTLEAVRTYHAGEWEEKADTVYKKCLNLSNQWNSVSRLTDQLGLTSHTAEDIIGLVEAAGDPKEIVKLLILDDNWESTCGVLQIAYAAFGRCQESKFVLDTVISIHPENPYGYLLLGGLFRHALQNANPPPKDSISSLRELLKTTNKAGEEWLSEIKASNPSFYRALTDREYEQDIEELTDMFSQVTLEALGCGWDFAYNRAAELFKEAMRVSRDKETKTRALSGLSSLKMYHKPE
jgi:hypothetical protein